MVITSALHKELPGMCHWALLQFHTSSILASRRLSTYSVTICMTVIPNFWGVQRTSLVSFRIYILLWMCYPFTETDGYCCECRAKLSLSVQLLAVIHRLGLQNLPLPAFTGGAGSRLALTASDEKAVANVMQLTSFLTGGSSETVTLTALTPAMAQEVGCPYSAGALRHANPLYMMNHVCPTVAAYSKTDSAMV